MILDDIWGSIVKASNDLIATLQAVYPDVEIGFVDWDAHANIEDIPKTDLIGPAALSLTEHSPQLIEVNFAIGVSTWGSDQNLFRHRNMISRTYELLRPTRQIALYDAETASLKGFMVCMDGTLVAPMTRSETRPWQYVQTSALLEPTSAS